MGVLIKMIPTSKRILRPPPISGLSIDATTSYGGGYLELVFRFCMSEAREIDGLVHSNARQCWANIPAKLKAFHVPQIVT